MCRGDLDLRLSVFEGSTPSIGALLLFAHLRAGAGGPSGRPAEYLTLCAEAPGRPASRISRTEVIEADVVRLVALLEAAGLPGRPPRVVVNESLLGEGPLLALAVQARRRAGSLDLLLQHAGFSGADAGPLRAVLLRLAELAPAVVRPAVRGVVDRLLVDRAIPLRSGRDRGGIPGAPIGGGTDFAAPGHDDRRATIRPGRSGFPA